MARITGDNGAFKVNTTGTTYADFAKFRQLNMDEGRDYYDGTCMGDGNIVEAEGKRRFALSAEFVGDSDDLDTVLVAVRAGGTGIYKLNPDTVNTPTVNYTGSMFLSGGLNIAVAQVITGSVNVRAAGTITLTTA